MRAVALNYFDIFSQRGVGTACVQRAKRAGAEVIACASSAEKLAQLRDLGADHGINYVDDDRVQAVHGLYGKPRVTGGGGVSVWLILTAAIPGCRPCAALRLKDGC